MSKFDDKMMRNFELYLNLQRSGEINMVSSRVQDMLGISKEEHAFIMKNYSELLDEYNALKVVDEVIADAKERVGDNPGKGKNKSKSRNRSKGLKDNAVDDAVSGDLDEQEFN